MYYMYVLKGSSNPAYYIGFTKDLRKRIENHNAGGTTSTRRGRPWKLLYYEAYVIEDTARDRERKLKQRGKAWQELKYRIDPVMSAQKGAR
jgi:putative endonuclease